MTLIAVCPFADGVVVGSDGIMNSLGREVRKLDKVWPGQAPNTLCGMTGHLRIFPYIPVPGAEPIALKSPMVDFRAILDDAMRASPLDVRSALQNAGQASCAALRSYMTQKPLGYDNCDVCQILEAV